MKPQSPVMHVHPFSRVSQSTASMNARCTTGGILPDWHTSNVRPGTARYKTR